ncbi:MAG: hypothetical protein F2663_01290 [Actinobacteria bacterium]|uniref:Unannotated protein n=1 Tax=freshwater metagenome TaxID=449393 RepID=A0A6J6NHE8_9ZZZZ|nr:hypothetical protein [Actinomycetota bacterium]
MVVAAAISDVVQVPLWLDLLAVFSGAVLGAVFAVRNHFDLAGVLALAMVTGFGGGVIRDVLLNQRPVAFQHNAYVVTAIAAALAGFFFATHIERLELPLSVLDAVTLAMYATVGVSKALSNHIAVVPAILIGVVAAVSGGVLRDVFVARVPEIFTPGTLYAIPAVIGTTIFAGLHGAGVGLGTNAPVAVSVIVVIRLAAYRFGVRGPRPVDATAVVWKRARAARIRPRRQR